MDTAWIQVFVLSLSECVAPSGKTVCQEQQTQYVFFDQQDCETMLQELVAAKANDENVIVNQERSRCLPTAKQGHVFASADEANQQLADTEGWGVIPAGEKQPQEKKPESVGTERAAYQSRLKSLPECNQARTITPCKIGQIIIESDAEEEVPIWQKEDEDEE